MLDNVLFVLRLADRARARLWIDGGWGVDALLGSQTREHGDLDVVIEVRHLSPFSPCCPATASYRSGRTAPRRGTS
jgi:hypothetical protein